LRPIARRSACETEIRNASTSCPESVRPLRSVIVPETTTGTRAPLASNTFSIAKSAAFATSVSNTVSTRRRSTPPSRSAAACSA
jgi:hypothetical protein